MPASILVVPYAKERLMIGKFNGGLNGDTLIPCYVNAMPDPWPEGTPCLIIHDFWFYTGPTMAPLVSNSGRKFVRVGDIRNYFINKWAQDHNGAPYPDPRVYEAMRWERSQVQDKERYDAERERLRQVYLNN